MATWYIVYSLWVAGIGADICPTTTMTCCPRSVEESMEAATDRNLNDFAPGYGEYLDVSEIVFFDHYGKCVCVCVCACIRIDV